MLEGLADVDWESVQDAYGPATELPSLLSAAADEDPETRRTAYLGLWDRVCHDGDVSETAAHACVPYLVELALGPPQGGRPEALRLLAGIAGVSFAAVDVSKEERLRPWWEARRAVRRQLFRVVRLLDSRDPELALATAALLACFPFEMVQLRPRLRAMRDATTDQRARDVLTFSLFLLGDRDLATMRAVEALEEQRGAGEVMSARLHRMGNSAKRTMGVILAANSAAHADTPAPAAPPHTSGGAEPLAAPPMASPTVGPATAPRPARATAPPAGPGSAPAADAVEDAAAEAGPPARPSFDALHARLRFAAYRAGRIPASQLTDGSSVDEPPLPGTEGPAPEGEVNAGGRSDVDARGETEATGEADTTALRRATAERGQPATGGVTKPTPPLEQGTLDQPSTIVTAAPKGERQARRNTGERGSPPRSRH